MKLIDIEFDVNDKIFFLHNNKIIDKFIKELFIKKTINDISIKYKVEIDLYSEKTLDQSQVFSTKEDLIKSL